LTALANEERKRHWAKSFGVLSGGLTAFSLFNVMRLGQLSPTGKQAALFGLVFWGYMTYGSLIQSHILSRETVPAQRNDR
jgi:hypothetical protein